MTNKDELIEIRLFKDGHRYKDDVFVAVNGKSYQIKRGEKVKVPKFVAEILEQSMLMDAETADMIAAKVDEFKEESKKRNI